MITMGCDIGSLFAKAVIINGEELAAARLIRTTGNIKDEIADLLKATLAEAELTREQIVCLGGTGNGADLVPQTDFNEDEVSCIGAAAAYYLPEVRSVIDVGGQSITMLLIDEEGEVLNIMRNDKCASGSGRLLEVMSEKLHFQVTDIDEIVSQSTQPVKISNQCGVFAESEVISHVNAGEDRADIVAGICDSLTNIVAAQARRFGLAEHYTITGGVARIQAMVSAIQRKVGGTYHPFPLNQQLAAAVGAALLGDDD